MVFKFTVHSWWVSKHRRWPQKAPCHVRTAHQHTSMRTLHPKIEINQRETEKKFQHPTSEAAKRARPWAIELLASNNKTSMQWKRWTLNHHFDRFTRSDFPMLFFAFLQICYVCLSVLRCRRILFSFIPHTHHTRKKHIHNGMWCWAHWNRWFYFASERHQKPRFF